MNQEERILGHFAQYGSITQGESTDKYGITRLSARIYDLRRLGHVIDREWEEAPNRYGERTRFARYIYRGRDG